MGVKKKQPCKVQLLFGGYLEVDECGEVLHKVWIKKVCCQVECVITGDFILD